MTERVTGIGAVLFRARDPEALRSWYAEHLGVTFEPLWEQEAGPTVWAPFEADTDYFGRAEQAWMITLRVRDLDAMVRQLREAGIDVERGSEEEYGRFARTWDPEGNPIELWEPR
jgi:predicted enzyme related to lactoylglutathione lyase